MNNINKSNFYSAINQAKALIQKMQNSIENGSSIGDVTQITEYGGLHISSDDNANRRNIEIALYEAINWKTEEKWSRKTINKVLETAIFDSINFGKSSSKSFSERLEEAINKLKTELLSPLKEWEFYFPVLGLTADDKKRVIGAITLIQGNKKNIDSISRRLKRITDGTLHTTEEKKEIKKNQTSQINRLTGIAIANVKTIAGDLEAARSLALEKVQTVIEVLNCFIPFLYGKNSKVQVYLPGEASRDNSINVAFQKDDRSSLQFVRHGAYINFDLADLTKQKTRKLGIARLSEILNKSKLTEMDERLFYASRFAGRAAVSSRREDSFLFYAIALESLLVGGNEQKDLTFLLSMRTALILGKNIEEREKIRAEVAKLYGIRSAIVHRGETKFSENDLDLIQKYTLKTIILLLTGRKFKQFEKKNELNKWLEKKMLTY